MWSLSNESRCYLCACAVRSTDMTLYVGVEHLLRRRLEFVEGDLLHVGYELHPCLQHLLVSLHVDRIILVELSGISE